MVDFNARLAKLALQIGFMLVIMSVEMLYNLFVLKTQLL